MGWLILCLVLVLMPLVSFADMPSDANIRTVAEAWLAKKPAPSFGAAMVQGRYHALIAKDLGGVVGYKAGLTNPAVQKRFNYDKPSPGTLYEMILSSPARVPAAFGARPVYEADLVAVVDDSTKLMAAKTPLQALEALKEIRPFRDQSRRSSYGSRFGDVTS